MEPRCSVSPEGSGAAARASPFRLSTNSVTAVISAASTTEEHTVKK